MRNKYSISGFLPKRNPIGLQKAMPSTQKFARNFSPCGNKRRLANFTIGATTSQAASPKSSFLTNSRAICIATIRAPLRKTAWH